ncbi:MAG: amidohydrolase family protein, partial [Rhodospirillales bacterium]|nr:amidohydrolase family protein [Rhodospirillales bacterium]
PADGLNALHDKMGIERAVIVQASCHDKDNRAALDAIAKRPGRYLGIAMVGLDVDDDELDFLNKGGIRGIRFNFVRHLGGAPDLDAFKSLVGRIEPLGWHLILHLDAQDIVDYADLFASLSLHLVIDHMGRVPAADGLDQEPLRVLRQFLTNDNVWVKISGPERCSATGHPFSDAVPIARALIETAPDRMLWGTDWPHPNMGPDGAPDDGHLVDLVAQYAPDEAQRQKLLVDNPKRLYGFTD